MRERKLGYCGLEWERCPLFTVTELVRRRAAQPWSSSHCEHLVDRLPRPRLEVEEMRCSGCRSTNLLAECSACRIRSCAREQRLASCAHCIGYGACELLDDFHSVHPDARAALEDVRTSMHTRA